MRARDLLGLAGNDLPPGWCERGHGERHWSARYGPDALPGVRAFLRRFAGAFLFAEEKVAFLQPDDRPMEIYRHAHRGWRAIGGDTLEWETFLRDLQSDCGLVLRDEEVDTVTLGEIYERSRGA